MEEKELRTGASCFLIKDERLVGEWWKTPIYRFLEDEGFEPWARAKTQWGVDWIYVNIYSKVYSKGMYGVALTKVVGNHAITFDEFLTIYNIYKKYDGFEVLKMGKTKEERLKEITDWMVNVEERAEQLEQQMLKEEIERLDKEHLQILETEWADYEDVWQHMLEQGKTPREALDFLNSFA